VQHLEQSLFFIPSRALRLAGVEFSNGTLTSPGCSLGVAVFLLALAINERSFRLSRSGLLLLGVAKLLPMDMWQLQATERYLSSSASVIALSPSHSLLTLR